MNSRRGEPVASTPMDPCRCLPWCRRRRVFGTGPRIFALHARVAPSGSEGSDVIDAIRHLGSRANTHRGCGLRDLGRAVSRLRTRGRGRRFWRAERVGRLSQEPPFNNFSRASAGKKSGMESSLMMFTRSLDFFGSNSTRTRVPLGSLDNNSFNFVNTNDASAVERRP